MNPPANASNPMAYIPHEPHPKQAAFLALPILEALYGGAAGGGKSDALLMAALNYVDVPGYSALILRRTYADLAKPDALIPRSKEWLYPTNARWNEQQKQWTFPSGATLSFGYLEHEDDRYHYQGAAYQYIGWDELTQFTETQYTYLFSRCRRPTNESDYPRLAMVPLRIRAASNPGGVGHEWVKRRFAIDSDGGHNIERPFIPARLEDNPSLDAESYDRVLSELDLVTRSQLRLGDWDIGVAGNVFQRKWWRYYSPIGFRAYTSGGIFIDSAEEEKETADYSVLATWQTLGADFYLTRLVREHLAFPDLVEACYEARAATPGLPIVIETKSSGKALYQTLVRLVPGVLPFNPIGAKPTRARAISPYVEAGNCYLPSNAPWLDAFLEEHSAFGAPESAHDDMVDTTSMALSWLVSHQMAPTRPAHNGNGHTNGYHVNGHEAAKVGRA